MVDENIRAHYDLGLEETRLLINGRARLEYVRTLELLDRVLPAPPAHVLDVGGATGAYALPLAERGYEVTLVDPVPGQVERANELATHAGLADRVGAYVGDARDLRSFGRDHDAVLMLGPLYHLTDAGERAAAFRESVRATRSAGVVVGVGISRYASLLDGLKRNLLGDPVFRVIVERDIVDGQHRNPDVVGRPEFFTTAYFHHPDDLEREAMDAGLSEVQLYAIEGPAWMSEDIDQLDHHLFAARAVESDRALMAATSHILVVGRVP